jgi:hypothetical protein
MQPEAVSNHILFQFVEDIRAGRFVNSTGGQILVSTSDTNQSNTPRWGKVTHTGPEVLDVKVGEYVLVEPGKWTNGFYIDDVRFWKTDEEQIMLVSDTPEATY